MNIIFRNLTWVWARNISFTYQAIQKLSAHLVNLCFAVFCKFWVILDNVWEEIVFLKWFVKFIGVRNIGNLTDVDLKYEFDVKN